MTLGQKKITLNKKAKEIFKKNEKRMKEVEDIITAGISEEDLEVFSKVIKLMKKNLEKY